MNNDDSKDSVKKIFGKTAKEIFSEPKQDHSEFHSPNAFCGNAGTEELKHLHYLLDKLTDKEIIELTKRVGIDFGNADVSRAECDSVLDEADREDFYREYHKILKKRP